MKLLVDKKEVITCAYAKGEISRRAYWLIENPKYVIVQYLSDSQEISKELHIEDKNMISHQEASTKESNKFQNCV